MFWRDAMKPNRGVSRSDLGVYCSPFIIVMDPPGGESEGFDKEIVRGLDVLVYEDRDHSVEIGHLSFSGRPTLVPYCSCSWLVVSGLR